MEEIKLKLCLFEGNNFGSWNYSMESILDQYELKQFIETDLEELVYGKASAEAEKLRKSEKCKAIINHIAVSQLENFKGKTESKEIFDSDSRSVGNGDQTKLQIEYVKSRLIDEFNKRNHKMLMNDGNKASTNATSDTVFYSKPNTKGQFQFKCYNCDKEGHKRSECKYKPKKSNFQKQNNGNSSRRSFKEHSANLCNNEEKDICFMVNENSNIQELYNGEICCVLDSRASEHMINSMNYLCEYQTL
ncbi:hypothetical protein WA026_009314 [Henosepilachna vigintioctopunctata]|uniref:CCHC-type domain-containing protein n=1 Tax=Henosepilachna vigintioctopunctata TaxID=420089 RepID=A0AAW1UVG4_9CUCU